MVKQLLLPILAVIAFIILVGVFSKKSSTLDWSKYINGGTPLNQTMTIGNKTINLEVAKTESDREKGLGGRTSLSADSGMLFVFDSKQVSPTFWMKDMLIPLDMIWISNGKVVKIDKNIAAPAAGTPDGSLKRYTAPQTVDYVLEVNAGFSDTNNVQVGDSVTLPTL